jgi:hypothetical protein
MDIAGSLKAFFVMEVERLGWNRWIPNVELEAWGFCRIVDLLSLCTGTAGAVLGQALVHASPGALVAASSLQQLFVLAQSPCGFRLFRPFAQCS